jgi:hypothetical protein
MYRLTTFGNVALPAANYDWDAGTSETVQALVRTVGGPAYDAYGSSDAPPAMPYQLRYQCVAYGATLAALRQTLDVLRALRGKRLKLYRMAEDDNTELHWAWARLMQVQASNTVSDQSMIWQPLTLVYQVQTGWHGALHEEQYNLTADDTTACAADNDGNVAVLDAVLTITAGDAAITELLVTISPLCQFIYDETIAAGEALVVDSGAFSVHNDGADAYNDFTLGGGQAVLEWLRLEPGETTVAVTITGGGAGATADLDYYDAWA